MKAPIRFLALLFGSLIFAAASDRAHAGVYGPPPGDNVNIGVSASSIGTNSTATLTVSVTRPNGTVEADGTVISAAVSPPTIGTIAGVGANGSASGSTSTLVGGMASFVFIAGNTPGTATVTISLPPVNGHPTSVAKNVQITVTQGNGINPSLQLTTATPTLPLNPYGVGAQQDGSLGFPTNYIGSPYIAEVTVQWRGLITGAPENGKVNVAIAPTTVAAYSTLDDPTTAWSGETKTPPTIDGNEFLTLMGNGTVDITAGIGTIYVHAGNTAGAVTLTVTATDPDTNKTISSQLVITVAVPPGSDLPTAVTLSQPSTGLYINNSNGPQSKLITATMSNIYGAPVIADSGIDNIQFDIVGPSGIDAKLYAVSATGVPQIGSSVKTSGSGSAYVYLLAGHVQGLVQIRATVDASDGNVDNGVTAPVTATTTVAVSDGQLYSLKITSPIVNAIVVNGITVNTTSSSSSGSGTPSIPDQPDGTYSLTVSAIAQDFEGNPVLPGTVIKFGLVDGPQDPGFAVTCAGLQAFQICGGKGNPQPGGLYFSAPDGQFKTAGGGAGSGDTLVVFGKQEHGAPAGNDDLESALAISQIFSGTQLFTQLPFNRNDWTGTSMLPGPLPYVIGHAMIGNINSPATTDSSGATTVTGTATTKLNYPISGLNRGVVIWAQGTGPDIHYLDTNGNPTTRLVTDAIVTTYPGIKELSISASPNPITGNMTVPEQVCVKDALGTPLPNVRFKFGFTNLTTGLGSVDGIANSGWTNKATDATGCVTVNVITSGVTSSGSTGSGSSSGPTLTFTAPGATDGSTGSVVIPIVAGDLSLSASPQALGGNGGGVTLTLKNTNGVGVQNVQLTVTCTGTGVYSSLPGLTNSNGQTTVAITTEPSLDAYKTPGSGSCTYATASGSPTATVTLKGQDLCLLDINKNSANCTTTSTGGSGGGTSGSKLTLIVDSSAATVNGAIVDNVTATLSSGATFSPGNLSIFPCSATAGQKNPCNRIVPAGITTVTISATAGSTGTAPNIQSDTFSQWQLDCGTADGLYNTPTTIQIAGDTTCTATFITTPPPSP